MGIYKTYQVYELYLSLKGKQYTNSIQNDNQPLRVHDERVRGKLNRHHLTPLAGRPLGAGMVVAGFRDEPLVLVAVPVDQPPAQVVHAVRLPAPGPAPTRLRALDGRNRTTHWTSHPASRSNVAGSCPVGVALYSNAERIEGSCSGV